MSRLTKLKPDPQANGDHTTYLENIWGQIVKYATYVRNFLNPTGFDEVKRVDMEGKGHRNKVRGVDVASPHVHDKETPGGVREAEDHEVPKRSPQKDGKTKNNKKDDDDKS